MSERNSGEGFWAGLKHAFAIPRASFTDQEREWLEKIARKVVERRLTTPAVLLLEGARPVNYVGAHVFLFFKPIISLVAPAERCDDVEALLEKREAAEALARLIERFESERAGAEADPGKQE